MAIVAKAVGEGKEFPLMAEGIMHPVVISEVKDLGMVPVSPEIIAKNRAQAQKEGKDPGKVKTEEHKVRLRYVNASGESIIEQFTVSLHERSRLLPRVKQILGRDPGSSFDLETLVGTQVQILVQHVERNGKKYANIAAVTKAAPGQAVVPPATSKPNGGPVTAANPITDADLPWA
jgi:hypothetical protein